MIARAARHPLVWLYAWFLVIPFVMTAVKSTVSLGTEIVVFTLLAIAYNLLMGYTGLVSFGHSAFFGLGGYAAGLVQIHLVKGMVVPLLAAVAVATLAGAVIGFLLMRKRGVYFSLLTLAFTQMFFYVVYGATGVTGGENGLGGIERLPLGVGVLRVDLGDKRVYYYATAVVAAAAIWVLWRVVHSPFGRVLQGIRENEFRAEALGYRTIVYRSIVNCLSAAMATLAGVLAALWLRYTGPAVTLSFDIMLDILLMVVIGGMGTLYGSVIGATIFILAENYLQALMGAMSKSMAGLPVLPQLFNPDRWLLWLGVLFVLSVYFFPAGIVGKLVARK